MPGTGCRHRLPANTTVVALPNFNTRSLFFLRDPLGVIIDDYVVGSLALTRTTAELARRRRRLDEQVECRE